MPATEKPNRVYASTLPERALLARYANGVHYNDCFSVVVDKPLSLDAFVIAFYTTWLFKLERVILKRLVARPSTDEDVLALAAGERDEFAAWSVEDRSDDQLLMTDFRGQTRSWFMVERLDDERTRLFFGSAVIGRQESSGPSRRYRLLLPLHRVYSRALLATAWRRALRPQLSR